MSSVSVVVREDAAPSVVVVFVGKGSEAEAFVAAFAGWTKLRIVEMSSDAPLDFRPGSRPFGVTVARNGEVVDVDVRPDVTHFSGTAGIQRPTERDETVKIYVWATDEKDARATALGELRNARYGGWLDAEEA